MSRESRAKRSRRIRTIDPRDPRFNERVAEALTTMEQGVRGSEDERKPTMREIREILRNGISLNDLSESSGIFGSSPVVPAAPSGLSTLSEFNAIVIRWDMPSYIGHSGTEIWRSDTSLQADAVQIGYTSSTQFPDYDSGNGLTFFYFIRHRSASSSGPFSDAIEATSSSEFWIGGNVSNTYLDVSDIHNGEITDTIANSIVLDLNDSDGPKVSIRVRGTFYSSELLGGDPVSLQAETGNAVSVTISRGGVGVATVVPAKIQTSLTDIDGQRRFMHILNSEVIDLPVAGDVTYLIQAARLFTADTDGFSVEYVVTALRA